MSATWVLRVSGLCWVAAGMGLAFLFGSQGACLGDDCNSRPLPGTGSGERPVALMVVGLLVVAAVGLFLGASARHPVRKAGVATALCAV